MRAICETCKNKDKCSYLANNKTGDCIEVQQSDYGYDEAVARAYEWIQDNAWAFMHSYDGDLLYSTEEALRCFEEYMEQINE